jgi:hypothetical protein
MDQQYDLDGPDMELASSIDEGAFSQRLQHLAVTRMTLTQEEQRNRQSTWNVPLNDAAALTKPRKIIDKPPKINVTALRKLRSPEKKSNANQAQEATATATTTKPVAGFDFGDDHDAESSLQSITFAQIASPKRRGSEIDDPLPNLKTPERNKPPPSLGLATKNAVAVHALAELGRRHSSLSSRGLSIRTLSDSWSEGGVPRSSPLSAASNLDSPEMRPTPRTNDSYLLQLAHLMDGNPPHIIVEPTRTNHTMEPMDGTDGSSLSSLDHRLPNKTYPGRSRSRRRFKQLVLIVLFLGSNVLFWGALTQPDRSMEMLQFGAQRAKHCADRYYPHAEQIVWSFLVNMNNQYGPVATTAVTVKDTPSYFSADLTPNQCNLPSHISCRSALNEKTLSISPPVQLLPILEMEDALEEKVANSDVGTRERTHFFHMETQFWVDMMHPTQCFLLEELCARPGGWNHILLLSSNVVHRPLSEIVGKSTLDDDVFPQKPLMDIVGEFFRERRKQKELKMRKANPQHEFHGLA